MSHIFVTLLGKVGNQGNYREATYEFEGGSRRTTRFFGLELCKQVRPDKLVVLGTTGSMWDNLLLESGLGELADIDDELLQLAESAQQNVVEQATLDRFSGYLRNVLGIPCELTLIPYGRDQQEQTDTLAILVNAFGVNDTATLDVTHGLRHLPMLVQQSALLLQTLKNVQIAAMYYGALDLTKNGITPVMRLDGLLEIDRWSEALSHYDKTGNYGVFVPLLEQSGFSKNALDSLRDAAFYEQTSSIQKAWVKLKNFLACLRKEEHLCNRHAILFLPALKKRFAWVESDKPSARQAEVAWLALENGNLLRATLYGFEAFLTQLTEAAGGDLDSHGVRHAAKEEYECSNGESKFDRDCQCAKPDETWNAYRLLRGIRNQLAHSSTHSHEAVRKAVASRAELQRNLRQIFKVLIPR